MIDTKVAAKMGVLESRITQMIDCSERILALLHTVNELDYASTAMHDDVYGDLKKALAKSLINYVRLNSSVDAMMDEIICNGLSVREALEWIYD